MEVADEEIERAVAFEHPIAAAAVVASWLAPMRVTRDRPFGGVETNEVFELAFVEGEPLQRSEALGLGRDAMSTMVMVNERREARKLARVDGLAVIALAQHPEIAPGAAVTPEFGAVWLAALRDWTEADEALDEARSLEDRARRVLSRCALALATVADSSDRLRPLDER